MSWLVVKTVPRREAEVAKALEAEGWVCWVPVRLVIKRQSRPSACGVMLPLRTAIEYPFLPGIMVARSEKTTDSIYAAKIRYFEKVWTDGQGVVRRIPEWEIDRWCDILADMNAKTRKRLEARDKRKDKPKTIRLSDADPEALKRELMAILFGQPMEAAA